MSSDLTFNCSWCHVLQRFVPGLMLWSPQAVCGREAEVARPGLAPRLRPIAKVTGSLASPL